MEYFLCTRDQNDDQNQPQVDEEGFSIRPDNPFESILLRCFPHCFPYSFVTEKWREDTYCWSCEVNTSELWFQEVA